MSKLLLAALAIAVIGNVVYQKINASVPMQKLYIVDRYIESFAISIPYRPLQEIVAAEIVTERLHELDTLNKIDADERNEKREIYTVLEETFPKANQDTWAEIKTQYSTARNQGMTASHSAALVSAVNHIAP